MMTSTEILVARPLKLVLRWSGDALAGIGLDWAAEGDESVVETGLGRELSAALTRYVAGEAVNWPELPVDAGGLTGFRREVLEELRRVPAGEVLTYGRLADRCGRPGAARAVGRVMATNPWPLVYPCHRVVGSNGKLTGFGPGLPMKKWLLELEGALPEEA